MQEKPTTQHKDLLAQSTTVTELQDYIKKTAADRGFSEETVTEKMLLMVEEIGELAKSLRKFTGLKVDSEKADKYSKVQHEMADIMFYLFDIANKLDINILEAFKEKEIENSKRVWK